MSILDGASTLTAEQLQQQRQHQQHQPQPQSLPIQNRRNPFVRARQARKSEANGGASTPPALAVPARAVPVAKQGTQAVRETPSSAPAPSPSPIASTSVTTSHAPITDLPRANPFVVADRLRSRQTSESASQSGSRQCSLVDVPSSTLPVETSTSGAPEPNVSENISTASESGKTQRLFSLSGPRPLRSSTLLKRTSLSTRSSQPSTSSATAEKTTTNTASSSSPPVVDPVKPAEPSSIPERPPTPPERLANPKVLPIPDSSSERPPDPQPSRPDVPSVGFRGFLGPGLSRPSSLTGSSTVPVNRPFPRSPFGPRGPDGRRLSTQISASASPSTSPDKSSAVPSPLPGAPVRYQSLPAATAASPICTPTPAVSTPQTEPKNADSPTLSTGPSSADESVESNRTSASPSPEAGVSATTSKPVPGDAPVPEVESMVPPRTCNGIEIRSDELRAATSKRLSDRSPNLPTPAFVSATPGRPIVSFQKDWKPSELARKDTASLPQSEVVSAEEIKEEKRLSKQIERLELGRSQSDHLSRGPAAITPLAKVGSGLNLTLARVKMEEKPLVRRDSAPAATTPWSRFQLTRAGSTSPRKPCSISRAVALRGGESAVSLSAPNSALSSPTKPQVQTSLARTSTVPGLSPSTSPSLHSRPRPVFEPKRNESSPQRGNVTALPAEPSAINPPVAPETRQTTHPASPSDGPSVSDEPSGVPDLCESPTDIRSPLRQTQSFPLMDATPKSPEKGTSRESMPAGILTTSRSFSKPRSKSKSVSIIEPGEKVARFCGVDDEVHSGDEYERPGRRRAQTTDRPLPSIDFFDPFGHYSGATVPAGSTSFGGGGAASSMPIPSISMSGDDRPVRNEVAASTIPSIRMGSPSRRQLPRAGGGDGGYDRVIPSITVGADPGGPGPNIPTIQVGASGSPSRPLPPPRSSDGWSLASAPQPISRANTSTGSSIVCNRCRLSISGRIVSAGGARFHPDCFLCHHCGEHLECVAFYPEPEKARESRVANIRTERLLSGQTDLGGRGGGGGESAEDEFEAELDRILFYCHLDYHELFSPRCKSCQTPIEGEVVLACGAEYHVGHFFCAQCGDPFEATTPFVEKDGYAWCVDCHTNRYSPKCRRCRKPVTTMVIRALGGEWHAECFCCSLCDQPFPDGQLFLSADGKDPVCVACEQRRLKM